MRPYQLTKFFRRSAFPLSLRFRPEWSPGWLAYRTRGMKQRRDFPCVPVSRGETIDPDSDPDPDLDETLKP
jgi:hypothetical protein